MSELIKKYTALGNISGEAHDYLVMRDNAKNIAFKGWEIFCDSEKVGTGRSQTYTVFITSGGNFVIQIENSTQWQGCRDEYHAKLCRTEAQLMEFLGFGYQAKYLYDKLEIDASETAE